MALLVVSAVRSRSWIESIHERVPGAAEHPWNEGSARLKIDFGGLEAIVELMATLAKAEGRKDAWHYAQLMPVAKLVYLPFAWVPSQTDFVRATAREPAYVGNAIELLAQMRAMSGSLRSTLGPLPEVPSQVPPVALPTAAASAGPQRVKATWLALSYAAWLSVETGTPLHGLYGDAETTYPEENWQLDPSAIVK